MVFVTRPEDVGKVKLDLGDHLGQLSDEIEGEYGVGATISSFVSVGPKQYAIKVVDAEGKELGTKVKCKGFAHTSTTARHINYDRYALQVQEFLRSRDTASTAVSVSNSAIRRTKDHRLTTVTEEKVQRLVYNKRAVQPDGSTLPFGY